MLIGSRRILVALFSFFSLACCQTVSQPALRAVKSLEIQTIHGTLVVEDPLAIELIESAPMQRLKNIRQYGTTDYLYPVLKPYSRFTHSLGVYYILKKFGLSRKEQIAGLLHDVSHTAFSHVTDALFIGNMAGGSYQDMIHVDFLKEHGIETILKKYGMTAQDMNLLSQEFPGLKQKHPNLCGDRIEYIIYAGYKEDTLSQQQIRKIHESLNFDGASWYFTDKESAINFARISLTETLHYWGGPESLYNSFKSAEILAYALDKGYISKEEITYLASDDELWHKINLIQDRDLQEKLTALLLFDKTPGSFPQSCAKRFYSKFRGVDPLIKTSRGMTRLSEIDKGFAREYLATKSRVDAGWCLPVSVSSAVRG